MQKFLVLLAVCLLAGTLALAQAASSPSSSTSQPSAQQQSTPSSAQSPQNPSEAPQPQQPSSAQTPKSGDTTVSNSQNSGQTNPNATPDQNRAQQPSKAGTRGGGAPWGWIVLGIVVVLILIAFATRGGTDRTERVERVERHDDDIRRVG